jgi:hypothetical protein
MYAYAAMFRAFQTAEAVVLEDEPSAPRPMPARCWLTRLITWLA